LGFLLAPSSRATVLPVGLRGKLGVALFLSVVFLAVGCGAGSGKTEQASREAGSAGETPPVSTPIPTPKGHELQSIPGMNADAALTTLQRPGLECWEPSDRGMLYACSSEEDLPLLYEGEIMGRAINQVSGVEARVFRRSSKDFDMASQPFLGLLATQLEYRGADSKRAYEFVNHNLSSRRATTTIGAARWTITTSDDSKVLAVTPA
jgi:hypothetical protein